MDNLRFARFAPALAAAIGVSLFAAGAAAERPAADLVPDWPSLSRNLARVVAQEYGKPDHIAPEALVWRNRGNWSTISVFRDMDTVDKPNILRQAVSYSVPLKNWRRLSAFNRGVTYDPVRHELVARSDSEAVNMLALNLADEVIRGVRSAPDAEKFYDLTTSLSAAGKGSRYMRQLLFTAPGR